MFDFEDLFTWGREVEAHGQKWQLLKSIGKVGYYLAIPAGEKLPVVPSVIYVEHKETTK